ncbi:MAG: cytochrome c [Deltaproteobacteria bacterium]|nr:cytochrome c [Deltaproteobacteria bacterium]
MRAVERLFAASSKGFAVTAFLCFSLFLNLGASKVLAVVVDEGVEDPTGDGKEVFLALKCQLCHSVDVAEVEAKAKSAKLRGPDLSTVGAERGGNWLAAFLRREETLEDKEHKKEFKGTDEELQAIVDWLVGLVPEP